MHWRNDEVSLVRQFQFVLRVFAWLDSRWYWFEFGFLLVFY